MPGPLHVEMNTCKVFVELNWEIILKNICMKLGYSSPKSLEFARKCSDHHKTWSILEIMYIAVADELLVPFVRHCKAENKDITVENYWLWSDTLVNPNYIFMQQITVITNLPNSEQSYKGKVKNHNYINRQNQSTTGKL